jgi:tetratricopeptide (TPR) repeat protein
MKLRLVLVFLLVLSPPLLPQERPAEGTPAENVQNAAPEMLVGTARAELKQGVRAYKAARYDEAVDHFRKAATTDPSLTNAHLYLATAYAQEFIPGTETTVNIKIFELATEQYKIVLTQKPNEIVAMKGLAGLYLQMKRFEDARLYYYKVLGFDPNDDEAYYSVGVIDWTQTFQPRAEERAKLGLKPDEPLKNKEVCERLKAMNSANIAEGIDNLNRAIALRPDYDDAMAYMNLMYREKADVECGDSSARAKDLQTADDWVDKTLAVKKVKARTQAPLPDDSRRPFANRPELHPIQSHPSKIVIPLTGRDLLFSLWVAQRFSTAIPTSSRHRLQPPRQAVV